jgi:transposase
MTNQKRYPEEFRIEAVKQVTERGHRVADVAARLEVSQHSLYEWIKRYGVAPAQRVSQDAQAAEVRRLKAELKRVTEERDILKKAAAYFAKQSG